MKAYTIKEMRKFADKVWRDSGVFPSHCPKCDGRLKLNNDYNYNSDWWASYTCTKCKRKIKFMPSDMGQTLPQLIRYGKRNRRKLV